MKSKHGLQRFSFSFNPKYLTESDPKTLQRGVMQCFIKTILFYKCSQICLFERFAQEFNLYYGLKFIIRSVQRPTKIDVFLLKAHPDYNECLLCMYMYFIK